MAGRTDAGEQGGGLRARQAGRQVPACSRRRHEPRNAPGAAAARGQALGQQRARDGHGAARWGRALVCVRGRELSAACCRLPCSAQAGRRSCGGCAWSSHSPHADAHEEAEGRHRRERGRRGRRDGEDDEAGGRRHQHAPAAKHVGQRACSRRRSRGDNKLEGRGRSVRRREGGHMRRRRRRSRRARSSARGRSVRTCDVEPKKLAKEAYRGQEGGRAARDAPLALDRGAQVSDHRIFCGVGDEEEACKGVGVGTAGLPRVAGEARQRAVYGTACVGSRGTSPESRHLSTVHSLSPMYSIMPIWNQPKPAHGLEGGSRGCREATGRSGGASGGRRRSLQAPRARPPVLCYSSVRRCWAAGLTDLVDGRLHGRGPLAELEAPAARGLQAALAALAAHIVQRVRHGVECAGRAASGRQNPGAQGPAPAAALALRPGQPHPLRRQAPAALACAAASPLVTVLAMAYNARSQSRSVSQKVSEGARRMQRRACPPPAAPQSRSPHGHGRAAHRAPCRAMRLCSWRPRSRASEQ